MANGIPLQIRLLLEATVTSRELTQLLTPQLVGLIRASTDHLEKWVQQAETQDEYWRHEGMLEQTKRMQEEYLKIQAEEKVEK
jgi:hypothetical protein